MADSADHLLRIDKSGMVHPVGRIASQQLRAREGEWRFMASARDYVVFRREVKDPRVLKLSGEIRTPGSVGDVVGLIAQSSMSGECVVIDEAGTRSLFFDHGLLAGVQTTVPSERLGETLYRFGVITRDQVEEAVKLSQESGRRLGEAAVELEFVSAEELYPMMTRQAEEVFYATMQVGDGMFYFFDRYDEGEMLHRHNLNTAGLLMEGARRMDELKFFREKIPNETYIPVVTIKPSRDVPEDLAATYAEVDGKRGINEIGRRVGMLEFEVTQAIFQLVNGGFVSVKAARPEGPVALVEAFNPALEEIHRACDAAGKGREIRDGLGRFATGGGVFDPLFLMAGPTEAGTFKAERVAKNLVALAGDDPDTWLLGLMHEYVGFGLFHAGSLLSREQETQLVKSVTELLKPVRPESK